MDADKKLEHPVGYPHPAPELPGRGRTQLAVYEVDRSRVEDGGGGLRFRTVQPPVTFPWRRIFLDKYLSVFLHRI